MTFFQIADEYERDFEELEEESLDSCAFATLLYVQLGHLSAKRMTDGVITPSMLRKRTAHWAPAALDEALDSLVRLRKVERSADGGVRFLDWDLTQFTAEQEATRRARAAERQRRHRAKLRAEAAHETIAENDNVTRDVTVPSASSSEEEEEKKKKEPPTGVRTAPPPAAPPASSEAKGPGPKKARPKDAKKAALTAVLQSAAQRHGFLADGLLSAKHADAVIKKATALAEREGTTLEATLERNVQGAWERHQATGKDLKWCVVDWQPGQPSRPSYGRPPKLEIAGCSPASEFGTEEEAWALLNARKAERLRAEEMRRVGT